MDEAAIFDLNNIPHFFIKAQSLTDKGKVSLLLIRRTGWPKHPLLKGETAWVDINCSLAKSKAEAAFYQSNVSEVTATYLSPECKTIAEQDVSLGLGDWTIETIRNDKRDFSIDFTPTLPIYFSLYDEKLDSINFRLTWHYLSPPCAFLRIPLKDKPVECLSFVTMNKLRKYPREALNVGVDGQATIRCRVVDEEARFKCRQLSETERGPHPLTGAPQKPFGFGETSVDQIEKHLKIRKIKDVKEPITGTEFDVTMDYKLE